MDAVVNTLKKQQLDGLILIGDCDSLADSAFVAEACSSEQLGTRVIGVPVSLHCDIPFVQQTVGHDTACRTLSAFMGDVGSLARCSDDLWIFVRVSGDASSHVAVQVALQTHPNMVLLAGGHGQCLNGIVNDICDLAEARHAAGRNNGIVMLPVGFVTEIVEMRLLFAEITEIMTNGDYEVGWESITNIAAKLKPSTAALFDVIPRDVQYEICSGGHERGTFRIDIGSIETERLLLRFVEIEFQRRKHLGLINEYFFRGSCYPMVYHARSSLPTDFDCDLGYTLGWGAALLVRLGKTGLLVHASNLENGVDDWELRGIVPARLRLLQKKGVERPFNKMLPPMDERTGVYQGPVQFWGEAAAPSSVRRTWFMQHMALQDPTNVLQELAGLCGELQSTMAQAKEESTLYAVNSLLANAVSTLDSFKQLDGYRERLPSRAEDSRRVVLRRQTIDVPVRGSDGLGS